MAALRSVQLFNGTASSGSYVTKYTVPSGKRIILRSVVAHNTTGTSTAFLVGLNGVTIHGPTLAANGDDTWLPWVVMDAGQTIDIATGGGRLVNVVLSGYLLFV